MQMYFQIVAKDFFFRTRNEATEMYLVGTLTELNDEMTKLWRRKPS